jgi:hypothetical protein
MWTSRTTTFGTTTLAGLGRADIFVANLTDAGPSGSFVWAQLAGGSGFEGVSALAVRGSSVYVCGFTTSAPARFGSITLSGLGDYDAFVARLLDSGGSSSFEWARRAGSAGSEGATSLVWPGATQVLVGGYTEGQPRFGPQVLSSATTESYGFLAFINDAAALAAVPVALVAAVEVYPNPAHASAIVAVPATAGAGTCTFAVLDALGRLVRTQAAPLPATGLRYTLDLAGLPTGLYALRISAGHQTATRCLVVE